MNHITDRAVFSRIKMRSDPARLASDLDLMRQLLDLAGGIPDDQFTNCSLYVAQMGHEIYKVEVKCPFYHSLFRIDYLEKTIIHVLLEVAENHTKKGLGTSLIQNTVLACQHQGFAKIQTFASGGWILPAERNWDRFSLMKEKKESPENYGYYTCGRFGFIMDSGAHEDFRYWKRVFTVRVRTLTDLLKGDSMMSKVDILQNRKLWLKGGFGWLGYFYIGENSLSMAVFTEYLAERKTLQPK